MFLVLCIARLFFSSFFVVVRYSFVFCCKRLLPFACLLIAAFDLCVRAYCVFHNFVESMRDTLHAYDGLNDDRLVLHALRGFGANLK